MTYIKAALTATAATLAMAGMATQAAAQDSGAYANVGVEAIEFDAYALTGRLGYQINNIFSVEGQGSLGIIDDKTEVLGLDAEAGLNYSLAGFGKATLPVGERFEVFGRAGYHYTDLGFEVDTGAGTIDSDVDTDGFAFGVGAEYALTDRSGIRVDYTAYDLGENDDGEDLPTSDNYSVAYVFKF